MTERLRPALLLLLISLSPIGLLVFQAKLPAEISDLPESERSVISAIRGLKIQVRTGGFT